MKEKQILELIPYFAYIIKDFEYTENFQKGRRLKLLQKKYNKFEYLLYEKERGERIKKILARKFAR